MTIKLCSICGEELVGGFHTDNKDEKRPVYFCNKCFYEDMEL